MKVQPTQCCQWKHTQHSIEPFTISNRWILSICDYSNERLTIGSEPLAIQELPKCLCLAGDLPCCSKMRGKRAHACVCSVRHTTCNDSMAVLDSKVPMPCKYYKTIFLWVSKGLVAQKHGDNSLTPLSLSHHWRQNADLYTRIDLYRYTCLSWCTDTLKTQCVGSECWLYNHSWWWTILNQHD